MYELPNLILLGKLILKILPLLNEIHLYEGDIINYIEDSLPVLQADFLNIFFNKE